MELGVSQDRRGHQLLLLDPEGFACCSVLVEVRDSPVMILFGVLDQWGRDGGIIRDEPPVVPTFSQEHPQGLEGVWDGPLLDD